MIRVLKKLMFHDNIWRIAEQKWLYKSTPWIGHTGRHYKRKQVQKKLSPAEKNETDLHSALPPGITAATTRSGQKVKKNHQLESSASKEGGVVGCREIWFQSLSLAIF